MSDLFRPTKIVTGTRRVPVRPPRTVRPPTEAGPITIGTNCATFTDSNVQTFTWPIPSDAKVGDLCFQFIHTYDDQVGSVPSGWTQGWAVNANVTHDYGYMYYKVLESADIEGNLTFDLDATGEAALLSMFARGEGITFADVTVSGPAGMDTAEHDPPAVTPTQGAGDYYVLVVFQNNKGSFTTSFAASGPTGYDAKCEIASASPKVHVWQATKSIVTSENPSEIDWTDTAGSRKYATATIAIPVQFEDGDVAAGNHTHDGRILPAGTTKGDLAVYDGSDWVRIGAGANDTVLTADSAETAGLKWAAGGGGGGGSRVSWTPDLTEDGVSVSVTVDDAWYVVNGDLTTFGASLSVTGTGTGTVAISNLPAALQSAYSSTSAVKSFIGMMQLHNSGTGVTTYRMHAYSATEWRFVTLTGFAYLSFSFASGDDVELWGQVVTA